MSQADQIPTQPKTRAAQRHSGRNVPYLGPDPVASIVSGRMFAAACVAATTIRFAAAWIHYQQARIDQRIADSLFATQDPAIMEDLRSQLQHNRSIAALVGLLSLLSTVLALVLLYVWRSQRRPKAVLKAYGETHVESPLKWALPLPHRFLAAGAAVTGVILAGRGGTGPSTTFAELPALRMSSAWANVAFALFWLVEGAMVPLSERAHAARLAGSAPHRAGLAPVHYVAPVRDDEFGKSENSAGIGWVLTTAGIFVGAPIATLILFISVTEHTLRMLPWALGALAVDALVVWAVIRKRRLAKERAAAPPPPTGAAWLPPGHATF